MATVSERITALENFELEDGQPNIEAPSLTVVFAGPPDYNYVDHKAFETKWSEEMEAARALADVVKRGDYFVNMLYTYRSCSKALPQVKAQDDPNKATIYEKTFEVLDPEIRKLKELMYFTRDAVKLFCEHVKSIAAQVSQKKHPKTISEVYIFQLIKMLDLFAIMDALKNMKACLNNDFSFYKRAFGFLRKSMANDDQTQENHTLYLFLAHQNSITTNLKTEVQQLAGFDDVIALIVNQCARYLELDLHVLPGEKHRLLRAMPYGLFLMDGENERYNIFKSRKISIARISKQFKRYPIVPLYGDMHISLEQMIQRSPHFDEKVWGSPLPDNKLVSGYEIVHKLEQMREKYNLYLSKFSNMINQINVRRAAPDFQGFEMGQMKAYTEVVLEGFRLLSGWSGKVLQQSAWKYAKPNTHHELPSDVVEYERVVKYNYTEEERFALIEFIACIKSLAGVMLRHDGLLSPIIASYIHNDLEEFIQVHLRDMISFASKKKRSVREEMLHLRAMAGDWSGGSAPDEPALFGKKVKKGTTNNEIPQRAVGPSPTQLDLVRTIVYGFVSHRILGLKKTEYSDKDFSGSSAMKVLEDYLQRSFYYPYLLDYTGTILKATDLADLWYREFYLELSKRLQFPIEMSLPWILTDHILESHRASSMLEFMLYPLDLYNDAANRALDSLHQRFLYDEIEAEVNLAFDQLVFKISEQIYTYFKIQASSILLDKPYKQQLEIIYTGASRFHPPKNRYDALLKQRHFELLGRSIDLNHLIAQRMNTKLRQNIDYAITRFEASDITTVIELETQLNNVRLTHSLLQQCFELDSYEEMFNEVNESTSLVSFHGRIVLHIIFELVYDFFPNFNFNSVTQRFIRAPVKMSNEEVPRDVMPKPKVPYLYGNKVLNGAYANVFQLYQQFFGIPHVASLLRLCGRTNLPLVISELLENMGLKIQNVLVPYVRELFVGMPVSSKLPMYDYRTDGNFGFFKSNLKDLMAYPELQTAFQHFKEFGNTVVLLNLFEIGLTVVDLETYMQAAPFLGIGPDTMHPGEGEDPTTASPLYVTASTVGTHVQEQAVALAPGVLKDLTIASWKADKFYRPSKHNLSLFKAALARIDELVARVKDMWAPAPADNSLLAVDSTREFYRLWSALQFVYCLPPDEGEQGITSQEKFGDGFMWGGLSLIYFLGQEQRFQVFDFVYHILKVEEAMPTVESKDPSLFPFLQQSGKVRDINQGIFNTLHVFSPIVRTNILLLHPPKEDHGIDFISHVPAASTFAGSSSSSAVALGGGGGLDVGSSSGAYAVKSPRDAASPRGPPSARGASSAPAGGVRNAPTPPAPRAAAPLPPPPISRDEEEQEYDNNGPPPLPRDDEYGAPPPLPRDDDDAPAVEYEDYGEQVWDTPAPPPLPRDDDAPPPLPRDDW